MARYDGLAAWYEDYITGDAAAFTAQAGAALTRLQGAGTRRWLDVGCGPGIYIAVAADLGWSVTGVDISEDQLRVARRRLGEQADLMCADAAALPFAAANFQAVYAMMIHTDVPDIERVFAEMGRVLAGGGRFVYVGTHPCFVAPFITREADNTIVVHPGYPASRRYDKGPGIGDGIRSRVGAYHQPLSVLIGALPAAGLQIETIEEFYGDPPRLLALRGGKESSPGGLP